MTRTILNSPFIAFFDYDSVTSLLVVYMRTGRSIVVKELHKSAYDRIRKADNRARHIYKFVLMNPVYDKFFGHTIQPSEVERILTESQNQKPQIYRWLAS